MFANSAEMFATFRTCPQTPSFPPSRLQTRFPRAADRAPGARAAPTDAYQYDMASVQLCPTFFQRALIEAGLIIGLMTLAWVFWQLLK